MVGDFKGPDGVDYSPIDLYAKYSVTPEQVRKMVQQTMMPQNPFKEVVHQQQRQPDEQMASISENIKSGKRKFAEMQARINAEEMAKALRTSPLVYDKVISALSALCGDPHYNANTSEDTMNDFVRSIIAASLEVRDQTRNGISGTSTSATQERSGELDIQIRYNGKPICVYEGLKLDSVKKKELYEHIVKATINYNPQGVKNVFVTAYVVNQSTHFGDFWDRFCDCVRQYKATDEEYAIIWDEKETDTEMSAIRVLHGVYKMDGVDHDVYVIAIKIQS